MKKLLSVLFLSMVCLVSISQKNSGFLYYDTVYVLKNFGNAELVIKNGTRTTKGFLFNTGDGRTIFKRGAEKLNDSTWLVGDDTLIIPATPTFGATWPIRIDENQNLYLAPTWVDSAMAMGSGSTPQSLQDVTDIGDVTDHDIKVNSLKIPSAYNGIDLNMSGNSFDFPYTFLFKVGTAWASLASQILFVHNGTNYSKITATGISATREFRLPNTTGTGLVGIKLNGNTYENFYDGIADLGYLDGGAGDTTQFQSLRDTAAAIRDQVNINTSDIAGKQAALISGINVKTINSNSLLAGGDMLLPTFTNLRDSLQIQRDTALAIRSQTNINTGAIAGKQATLVSGTNLKTINSSSLLAGGDLLLPTFNNLRDSLQIQRDTALAIRSQTNSNTGAIAGKQATLVSGINLKSINSNSLLAGGDLLLPTFNNLRDSLQILRDSVKKYILRIDSLPGGGGMLYIHGDGTKDTAYTNGTPDIATRAAYLGYKQYSAFLNQTGTNAPVASSIDDMLGGAVWARTGVGTYTLTKTGAFILTKTIPYTAGLVYDFNGNTYILQHTNINVMTLTTYAAADPLTPADGVLSNFDFLIKVKN